MVELKVSSNSESPISAMVQLLSYYLFFREAEKFCKNGKLAYPKTAKRVKLTILAPEGYYNEHLGATKNGATLLGKIAKTAYGRINQKYKTKEKISPLSFKKITNFKEGKIEKYKKVVTEIRESCTVWENL